MKVIKFLKKHKQFTVFSFLAVLIILTAVFAPVIAPRDPLYAVMNDSLKAPGAEYICGADKLGRDALQSYFRYKKLPYNDFKPCGRGICCGNFSRCNIGLFRRSR